jgi:hypothetical protein
MIKITTGDLARALVQEDFPVATDDMARAWCEAGLLEYWKSPIGQSRYYIKPECLPGFLSEHFKFSEDEIKKVGASLGVKFKQGAK